MLSLLFLWLLKYIWFLCLECCILVQVCLTVVIWLPVYTHPVSSCCLHFAFLICIKTLIDFKLANHSTTVSYCARFLCLFSTCPYEFYVLPVCCLYVCTSDVCHIMYILLPFFHQWTSSYENSMLATQVLYYLCQWYLRKFISPIAVVLEGCARSDSHPPFENQWYLLTISLRQVSVYASQHYTTEMCCIGVQI